MPQFLQNALCGSVMILAVAALRRLLPRRLIPEARLALWAACLFRLLTPVAPESALSVYGLLRLLPEQAPAAPAPVTPAPITPPPVTPAPPGPSVSAAVGTVLPAPSVPYTPPAPSAPPAAAGVNWAAVLAAVWLLGAAVLAVRYVLSWLSVRREVGSAALLGESDPRYAALPQGIRLRVGTVKGAPLTFGAVRPTVVLPPGLSGAALELVLAHEGVHARRRDNFWHYAAAIALTVFWWNPAVWLMARLIRRDVELSCDRAVLRRLGTDRRREYAMTLLSLSTQAGGSAFCHTFGQKQAEERILAIMKFKKMSLCSLILAIVLVCSVAVAFATDPIEPPEEPIDSTVEPVEPTEEPTNDPVEPADPAEDPTDDPVEPAESGEPAEVAPTLPQIIEWPDAIIDDVIEVIESLSTSETSAQLGCTHPNLEQGEDVLLIECPKITESGHTREDIPGKKCPDCDARVYDRNLATTMWEAHSFGAGTYVGSNHTAADPSQHYLIFSHKCSVCRWSGNYTTLSHCTERGCVEPYSVGDVEE